MIRVVQMEAALMKEIKHEGVCVNVYMLILLKDLLSLNLF